MRHYLLDPAFVSALIGGMIVAVATLIATKITLDRSVHMEAEHRRDILRGMLRGIRTELSVLWDIYEKEMDSDPLKEWHVLPENYFTVYESNCSSIGQIDDDPLRSSIITTYLLAKSLLNAHLHNNILHQEFRQFENITVEHGKARKRMEEYQSGSLAPLRERARQSFLLCMDRFDASQLLSDGQ
jgi:hypothetical protein